MSSNTTPSREPTAAPTAGGVVTVAAYMPEPIAGDTSAERIDLGEDRALAEWCRKLDTTKEQLRKAIDAVGDRAADVEMHLKGSHGTTNADRVKDAGVP